MDYPKIIKLAFLAFICCWGSLSVDLYLTSHFYAAVVSVKSARIIRVDATPASTLMCPTTNIKFIGQPRPLADNPVIENMSIRFSGGTCD
jgi:hypothetical protein